VIIIYNNLFLLNDLSNEENDKIISLFDKTTKFQKGEIIYSKDKFSHAIGYVIEGTAAALTNNSDGIYMKTFSSGNVFGAAAVFGNDKDYISTIIAKTDIEILFITEDTLKEIFNLVPKCGLNYITFLSEKIRFLNKKLNLISCNNAEDTVFNYLLGIKDENNIVKIPVSMTLLAKMLGLGRASLYRCLDNLEYNGKIKRENNIIKVI